MPSSDQNTTTTTQANHPHFLLAIAQAPLPAGWVSEDLAGYSDIVALTHPGPCGGYVSIDFKQRAFAGGFGTPRGEHSAKYKGRGWQAELVRDAVAYLDKVMTA